MSNIYIFIFGIAVFASFIGVAMIAFGDRKNANKKDKIKQMDDDADDDDEQTFNAEEFSTNDYKKTKTFGISTWIDSMDWAQRHRFPFLENAQMFLYMYYIVGKQATHIGTNSEDFMESAILTYFYLLKANLELSHFPWPWVRFLITKFR